MDGGGSVLMGQRLHLHTNQDRDWGQGKGQGRGQGQGLTTPIRSPRPYSPISSFFPSSFMMTERSRPLSTMKVLSDFSFCLQSGGESVWLLLCWRSAKGAGPHL